MATRYDFLLNEGFWLEYHCSLNPGENEFILGYEELDDPIQIIERLSHLLSDTMTSDFTCKKKPATTQEVKDNADMEQ